MVGGKPIQPVLRIKRFETLGVRLLSPTPDPHPNPPSLRSGSPSHGLPPAVRRRLGSLHGEERNSSAARLPTTASPTSTAAIGSLALGSWLLAVELLRAGARALPGAPGERREAVESPAGLAAWMRPRISTGQGWPVEIPDRLTRTLGAGMHQGRGRGVPFLLVTSLYSGHPALRPCGAAFGVRAAPAAQWARKEK
jgi:hypothetical protein